MGNFLPWLQAFASSNMNPLLCRLLMIAKEGGNAEKAGAIFCLLPSHPMHYCMERSHQQWAQSRADLPG
jgi:hypothetical protein